mgnify:CR=1 FL=1
MGINDAAEQLQVAIAHSIVIEEENAVLHGRLARIANALESNQPKRVKLQVIGHILEEGEVH